MDNTVAFVDAAADGTGVIPLQDYLFETNNKSNERRASFMKKRKMLENQGVDVNIDELEDEVWERNEKGELVKLEVADDVEDDPA